MVSRPWRSNISTWRSRDNLLSEENIEVSYKILHIIYPVKELFDCFSLNFENLFESCSNTKESVIHFFVFFMDLFKNILVGFFISRLCGKCIQIDLYDVIFFFVQDDVDSITTIHFIFQLILFGKYYIHVKNGPKLSQTKLWTFYNFQEHLTDTTAVMSGSKNSDHQLCFNMQDFG